MEKEWILIDKSRQKEMGARRHLLWMLLGCLIVISGGDGEASSEADGPRSREKVIHVERHLSAGFSDEAKVLLLPEHGLWGQNEAPPPRERNPLVYFYSRGGKQIKNRGAEVFHQLHDAVRAEGIMSFIEEGVDEYQTELSQFIHDDEREGMMSILERNDFVVVTAVSHSFNEENLMSPQTGAPHLANVTRLIKWQIGYSFPSIRFFVDDLHVQICDTHFLADVFGCVKEAVLRAPPLPAYYDAAKKASAEAGREGLASVKERLILIDNDHQFDISKIQLGEKGCVVVKLDGMSREEMFDAYRRAVAVIDLWMPGAETVTAEAALFDCCVIVSDEMNGANPIDFPIDPSLKVGRSPGGDWNYTHLSLLIQRALDDYDNFVWEFAALKAHVQSLPAAFQASVRRYFLSDVHFVAIAPSPAEQRLAMPWAASVLMNYPLATVQIIVPSRLSFGLDNAPALELLRHRGLANSITITDGESYGGFQDKGVMCVCDVRKAMLRGDMLEEGLAADEQLSGGNLAEMLGMREGRSWEGGVNRSDLSTRSGPECVRPNYFPVVPLAPHSVPPKVESGSVLEKPLMWDGTWQLLDDDDGLSESRLPGLSRDNCLHLRSLMDNKVYAGLMPYFSERYVRALKRERMTCDATWPPFQAWQNRQQRGS